MKEYGLSRREAASHYREMKEHLGRSVFRSDLTNHPRIAKKEATLVLQKRVPPKGPPIPPEELPPTEPEEMEEEPEEMEEEELDGTEEEGEYNG